MNKTYGGMQPVEKAATLANKVGAQLRAAIMAGAFNPGEKLTHRSVADALHVSLTPAREALFTLVSEGTLEGGPYGTIFVPTLKYDRIRELTKIRTLLEGLAAEEAATKLSNAAIANLVETHDQLINANERQDYRVLANLNWQFHFGIYEGAEMPIVQKMIESCWLKTSSYYSTIYPKIAESGEGIKNHHAIVQALQKRDPKKLAAAIRTDVEFGSQVLLSAVKEE